MDKPQTSLWQWRHKEQKSSILFVLALLFAFTLGLSTTALGQTVSLSLTGSPMAEGGGVATVTATLSATTTQPVTVNLAFTGTATVINDYTRSGTAITVAAGSLTGQITLTAVQDLLDEANETIIVAIDTVINATESGTQQVTATITDNDPLPAVTLSLSGSPMAESAGAATVTATLSAVSGRNVTVNLAFSGTATLNSDYTRSGTAIVIPAGSLSSQITLTAVQDAVAEANETIIVDISSVANGTESGIQQVTATITNINVPTVTLALSGSPMAEGGGVATVTATLSATTTLPVTVNLAFTGTATLNSDYTRSGTAIIIPAGSLSGQITLTAVQDVLDEANETIIVAISTVTNAVESGTQRVTATITDNDPLPTATLSLSGSPMAESAGAATVTATLSAVSGRNVTVNLAFSGTAILNSDYTSSGTAIVIPAGSLSGQITLTAVQDVVVEANETIIVDISTVTNGTESGAQQVTATITDDEAAVVVPTVTLALSGSPMAEGGGVAIVTATLSVTTTVDVTVNLAFSGTATLTSDYTRSGTAITIPAGNTSGQITLTAVQDTIVEGNETIIVDISTVTNGTESGTQQITATITDGVGAGHCTPPIVSPIACENSKPGNPATEWDVSGAGSANIQGFVTDISVNKGETVSFKIDTNSPAYRLDIYRMGYYGGLGARKVTTVLPSASLPQNQPSCLNDATTGLIDCGNWSVSASWTVPTDEVSGIYFAKAVREDGVSGSSHIVFVVRDDSRNAEILFQTSDTTWQAYNQYGGNSLYVGSPNGRAYKVSYNRPFTARGCCAEDWVFNAEYPMVRWLEANGYDVSYFTGVDTDRRGAQLLNHRVFLSVGHDEYWSGSQRANVEAARNAGVHLAFFSGNEVFWKTRWENSIDGSGTPYRTLVSYKETHANAKIDPLPDVWTGTWRDPRFSPPADGGRPENALTGTIFTVNAPGSATDAISVPAADGAMRFWRNTSVATLAANQTATLTSGTLGYEWDEDLNNGFRPAGLIKLSTATYNVASYLLDYGSTFGSGTATHNLTLYRHPSGALVFGAGTVQYSWGLDSDHDSGSAPADIRLQQATVNLFADMGVQPVALQSGLLVATPSTDASAPTSAITSPTPGTAVPVGATVTVTGTASDSGGGVVGAVEVSVDGGATWRPAVGRASWTFVWTPSASGSVTIRSRAVDDSGNIETPGANVTVTVGSGSNTCPCTIWNNAAVPALVSQGDNSAVELGVKFRADVDGSITGLRFYKSPNSTGQHVGNLWTSNGTLLATVTFTNATASGWQQMNLLSPVAITANTTYVVSYHTVDYAVDIGYFATSGVNSSPLRAIADGEDGPNGVYLYGSGGFPTQTWNSSNYWADVVFSPTGSQDTTPPTVVSVNPTNGATGVSVGTTVAVTFSENMAPATINPNTVQLFNSANAVVNSTVSYDVANRIATLTPIAPLSLSSTYTVNVIDGASGVKDLADNALLALFGSSFTTASSVATSIWSSNPIPELIDSGDNGSVELGVKFRSDVAGFITGIRFYKAVANTGTHTGRLWSSTGSLLASAPFTGETTSGWQQASFASPVAINANTTYVASYFAPVGRYSANSNYFTTTGFDNGTLHALSSPSAGGNGVYVYGSGGFPSQTFNATNYWVDIVFSTTAPVDNTPPTINLVSPSAASVGVDIAANVNARFSEAMARLPSMVRTSSCATPCQML